MSSIPPARPILRYLGSKWRMAPFILQHLPPHGLYVEPFGGSAAVLAQKPRCNSEIYNDLDGEVVHLFSVLRGPLADDLIRQIALTPYARAEHELSYQPTDDPVERARRLLVRSHMGHGNNGTGTRNSNGWRVDGVTNTNDVAGQWAAFPEQMGRWVERLRGVQLERRPALQLIRKFNVEKALIYLDPPYLPATRSKAVRYETGKCAYAHEMTPADHDELLAEIVASRAMIVLSGYHSETYDTALAGWRRLEFKARAHGNLPRVEVLWINPAAQAAMPEQGQLFESAA